jgi:predicted ATP-grasp superfamily ATP-dependent carboligase
LAFEVLLSQHKRYVIDINISFYGSFQQQACHANDIKMQIVAVEGEAENRGIKRDPIWSVITDACNPYRWKL